MASKQYKIVGKTPQMRSILVKEGRKYVQKNIRRGIEYLLDESEITFHIRRAAVRNILRIEEIDIVVKPPEEIKNPKGETRKRVKRS